MVINTKNLKLSKEERKSYISQIKYVLQEDIKRNKFKRIDTIYDMVANHYKPLVYMPKSRLEYILDHIDDCKLKDYEINKMYRIVANVKCSNPNKEIGQAKYKPLKII